MNSWSSGAIHPPDLLNVVFHILNKNNVEFIRAPYSAWAQVRENNATMYIIIYIDYGPCILAHLYVHSPKTIGQCCLRWL
jgi:hypothetical protein